MQLIRALQVETLLSQVQTPTPPRRAVGFFGSGRSPGHPSELITQLTLDWPLFILANPFSRDLGYALAASSCEGAHSVEYAPSRPLMRSLLSQGWMAALGSPHGYG
jgi:hypothetical protein